MHLKFTAFSRSGLTERLEYEGFTNAEAVFAVDHVTVDWNEQAALVAELHLKFVAYSRSELIEQLESEGFTQSQAAYGADKVGL